MLAADLRVLFWELSARCNLQCQHCRGSDQSQPCAELTTAQLINIAKDIRKCADPVLVLTGGEPLLRDDFFQLAEITCQSFSHVALATNGTLIDQVTAQKIKGSGIKRVSISLDGADAHTHDIFRGQTGSFNAAIAGYNELKKTGMSMQINTTITRHNNTQLEKLVDNALTLEADAFHLFILVPVGCGAQIPKPQRMNKDEVSQCLYALHKLQNKLRGKLHIKATCAPQYYRILKSAGAPQPSAHPHMHATTRGCLAGSGVCFISHTGQVQPCGYLPVPAGNVTQADFGTIWKQSEVFNNLRNPQKLQGTCGKCAYNTDCMGCRARAYATSGDYMSADGDCFFSATSSTAAEVCHD